MVHNDQDEEDGEGEAPGDYEGGSKSFCNLVRQGYAVTCIINIYDFDQFAKYSGPLISVGINTLHLRDEESLGTICRQQMIHS